MPIILGVNFRGEFLGGGLKPPNIRGKNFAPKIRCNKLLRNMQAILLKFGVQKKKSTQIRSAEPRDLYFQGWYVKCQNLREQQNCNFNVVFVVVVHGLLASRFPCLGFRLCALTTEITTKLQKQQNCEHLQHETPYSTTN